eukprot:1161023-Pelagomonas_calceolata.AAC.12
MLRNDAECCCSAPNRQHQLHRPCRQHCNICSGLHTGCLISSCLQCPSKTSRKLLAHISALHEVRCDAAGEGLKIAAGSGAKC